MMLANRLVVAYQTAHSPMHRLIHRAAASIGIANDIVWYHADAGSDKETRRAGTIQSYDNNGLVLRTLGGREITIPVDQVVRFEYPKSKMHQDADQAAALEDFAAARLYYRNALRADKEKRAWVRTQLTAKAMECRQALGDYKRAGDLFVNLARRDADRVFLDKMPLAWTSSASVAERVAKGWLEDSDRASVQLLAASHMKRSPSREQALAILRKLAKGSDTEIALLASCQLWQTQIPTATDDDVKRWARTIEKLPERLRSGPYFVVGRGQAVRKQHQAAALTMMRVPILFPRQKDIAAEALLYAGSSLSSIGQKEEATRVLRELVAGYPDSYAAKEAKQRLEKLGE